MEVISDSFLIIYLIIMGLTLISSTICYILGIQQTLSVIALILSLGIPLVNLIFSAQRTGELNGYEYLISQFREKDLWAIFIILAYVYLAVWWILFINRQLMQRQFYKWGKEMYLKLHHRIAEYWRNKTSQKENNEE